MRKFWYAFMLLSVFLVGCNNTDDLWDEVNDLKKRVTALETQIKDLNGNIEALRELCKEGTTITGVTQKDGAYTITLSDGKVLNLVEKTENTALFPLVSVDKDGYWTVSYDNGKTYSQIKDANSNPIKATGTDGATPKFRTDADGYWQVDYNDGKGYIDVLDENGQKVNALGNGGGSGSETTDKFFKEVIVKQGELYIKMADGTELSVPIVSDFECSFATADQNKVHEFAAGETKEFIMTVKGVESTMITAPEGWKVKFSKDAGKENVLVVTAPGTAAKTMSRATADNSTDIAILATHGKFATIAKIQVSVKAVVDYKAMYDAGEDIVIGGVTVNKTTHGASEVIDSQSGNIELSSYLTPSEAKILFLTGNNKFIISANKTIDQSMVIISQFPDNMADITIESGKFLSLKNNILLKNIKIRLRPEGYSFNGVTGTTVDNFIFDGCLIYDIKQPIYYMQNNTFSINKISITNSKLQFNNTVSTMCLNLGTSTPSNFKEIVFENNIFYHVSSVQPIQLLNSGVTASTGMTSAMNFKVHKNSFINIKSSNGFIKADRMNLTFTDNLFSIGSANTLSSYIYNVLDALSTLDVSNNKIYDIGTVNWNYATSASQLKPANNILDKIDENPFTELNTSEGIFTKAPQYADYGATIK